ncbi:hypothetical protein B0T16DRAFT_458366 [Cercophora newfieldiana]|uniref:Uncharacterized protein n=1 Tax=Cercophora newfieldiana TaxID=92897 RepID=A0AA40CPN3_9PEZI|nr:hypothetical protein B0T16DRAFT_458366 [Cercophora newfieldiana]
MASQETVTGSRPSTQAQSLGSNLDSLAPATPATPLVATSTGKDEGFRQMPRSKNSRQPLFLAWWLEFGALILSATSLISAAVVLALYDGKPMQDWGLDTISINTVISVLGVISKVTLAFAISSAIGQHKWNWFRAGQERLGVFEKFDEASRGPLGSASLLLWSRAANWAALGATVTITALLVDPFLQAAVSLRGQDDDTPTSTGVLPVAEQVDIGILRDYPQSLTRFRTPDGSEFEVDNFEVFPSFGVTSAFYDGLSESMNTTSTASSKTPSFLCSTGNCTWPLYTTAALCSRCNDISDRIIKTSGSSPHMGYYNATDYWLEYVTIGDPEFLFTNFSVGNGHILQFDGPLVPKNGFNGAPGGKPVLLTAFVNFRYSASVSFQDLNTTVATFIVLRAGDDFQHQNVAWEDSKPTATECALYFCAKAYRATVANGVLNETLTGTWAIREPKSWNMADHSKHAYKENEWRQFDTENPDLLSLNFFRTDLQLIIPPSELDPETPVTTRFNITHATINALQTSISSLFVPSMPPPPISIDRPPKRFVVYPNNNPIFLNDIPEVMWSANDLTAAFQNTADHLTVRMRDVSEATQVGQVKQYVLHFEVNWGFFSLLVITLALGCLYFAGVLYQTHRLGLPSWKESAYPVMANGFAEETQSLLRTVDKNMYQIKGLEHTRSGMEVMLVEADGGYRLEVGMAQRKR